MKSRLHAAKTVSTRVQTRFCYEPRPDAVKDNFPTRLDAAKKILKMRLDAVLYKTHLNAI